MTASATEPPGEFRRAVAELRGIAARPEIELLEAPAPQRLAPYALAVTADVILHDDEVGTGRLVVLYDPAGQDAWEGRWRVVVFARAELETEMSTDLDVLPGAGWSWLTEALAEGDIAYTALGGTVTGTHSQHFGALAGRDVSGQVELRASWTPLDDGIGAHVAVWLRLLAKMAGLQPLAEGVTSLRR